MGNPQGVGRIYQQTFIDTYSKVSVCKTLYNDKVLPYFESQGLLMLRILTDRGSEYCGKVENHDYELYLAINDIEHSKNQGKTSADSTASANGSIKQSYKNFTKWHSEENLYGFNDITSGFR